MIQLPETLELETGARPDAAVIWLHGLGADGHDFEPVVPMLGLPAGLAVRFVFPHAPVRPVTINMGMVMRAWYDILQLGGGPEDADGIQASQGATRRTDRARRRRAGCGVDASCSPGSRRAGRSCCRPGLRFAKRLAGILALSTYLPLATTLADERAPTNCRACRSSWRTAAATR